MNIKTDTVDAVFPTLPLEASRVTLSKNGCCQNNSEAVGLMEASFCKHLLTKSTKAGDHRSGCLRKGDSIFGPSASSRAITPKLQISRLYGVSNEKYLE